MKRLRDMNNKELEKVYSIILIICIIAVIIDVGIIIISIAKSGSVSIAVASFAIVVFIINIIDNSVFNSVLLIKSIHQENKSKSSKNTLSYKDNLSDMNKNFQKIKDYYELCIYTNEFNNDSIEYRIYSKPYWKDVSRIFHDTIRVYLKHMPFEFPKFSVEYTLSDYTVCNSHDLHSFMKDKDLDETDVTTLYHNDYEIGYLGIHKYSNGFYDISILEDVGIDKYISISFEYNHKLKNGKGLDKIIQKVII